MLKLINWILKFIVVGILGTICLAFLELLALILWNGKYMNHATEVADLLSEELRIIKKK